MKIVVHDGFDTIGGNKISVCSRSGDCALLDFGLNFSRWATFFEEFVNPRTGRVIEDLLKLGLIPEIPVYREDLTEIFRHDGKYKFVFLSHAHADHSGMVGLLDAGIPVLATAETLAIVDADSQFVKSGDIWRRFHATRREKADGGVVRDDLRRSTRKPLKRKVVEVDMNGTEKVNSSEIWDEFIVLPVYHSVIGASALAMKVDGWWVVYTGDLRMGPSPNEEKWWLESLGEKRLNLSRRTESFVEKARELHPMVLIVEGTRVTRKEVREQTERDVYENSLSLIRKSRGLVLVDFTVRHLERLMTFLKVAMETDRKLLLPPKEYVYLLKLQEMEPAWRFSDEEEEYIGVYHVGKLTYEKAEREVLETMLKNRKLVEPADVNSSPADYIVHCGYWTITTLLDFDERILKGAVYIHSTSEAYTEEQQIDAARLLNWLKRFSIEPHGITVEGEKPIFTGEFHASGHISPRGLEILIERLQPEIIIPVHTLQKSWFEERWKNRVWMEAVFTVN